MPLPILAILLAAQQTPATGEIQAQPYRPAQATVVVEPVGMMLAGFDTDGDGRITEAEASAGVTRSFTPFLKGGTDVGFIAFADWAEQWLGDRNAVPSPFEIDRDGNGRITLQELQDRMSAIFARFDADRDHVLTHKELLTIRGSAVNGDHSFDESGRRRRGRRR